MSKITFREINYDKDVAEVVALLQLGLNSRHSEASFLWKHYNNPFGKSQGLIAEEGGKIVGLRLFMQWQFRRGQKTLSAIRPVDTVTHPAYRGKGIFKKLTLEALDRYGDQYELIFNTPNTNSREGYLKMGWKDFSKNLHFSLAFVIPLLQMKGNIKNLCIEGIGNCPVENRNNLWRTARGKEYFQWRYSEDKYLACQYTLGIENVFIIYRKEKRRHISTVIIFEIIGNPLLHTSAVKKMMSYEKVYGVYFLSNCSTNLAFSLNFKRRISQVVLRNDQNNVEEDLCFCAGDLEAVF